MSLATLKERVYGKDTRVYDYSRGYREKHLKSGEYTPPYYTDKNKQELELFNECVAILIGAGLGRWNAEQLASKALADTTNFEYIITCLETYYFFATGKFLV